MESISQLTHTLNVFVRFFESINMLFCQVRWLESNIRNTRSGTFCIVFSIIGFCILMLLTTQGKEGIQFLTYLGLPPQFLPYFIKWGPIILIIAIIGLFLHRRASLGPQSEGGWDHILFGNRPRHGAGADDTNIEEGVPIYPTAPHIPNKDKYFR